MTLDRRTFLQLLAGCAVASLSPRARAGDAPIRAIAIVSPGSSSAAGARPGAAEAAQPAALFGRRFELLEVATAEDAIAALLRNGGASAIIGSITTALVKSAAVPCLEINSVDDHVQDGRYRLTPHGGGSAVAWHPELKRFGAGQLNERFTRATGRRMDSAAWTAWVATKFIVETALREVEIAELAIDGHKGVPLRFDARRVLQQPLYQVDGHGNLLDG